MKKYLKRRIKGFVRGLPPKHIVEALGAIRSKPIPWDQAAIHFDDLRNSLPGIGYPQYLYGLLSAARTARAAKCTTFTAIEFGVAGGNGLVAMEKYAAIVEERCEVSIQTVGFDMSAGLPMRADVRDCPFAFGGGEFRMDEHVLRSRLTRAELRLGDVHETVTAFMNEDFHPIGFVSHDLDLYTSTRDSLKLFSLEADRYLPRITMYFDDLDGYPYTTVTGEWAAISEFNAAYENRPIGQVRGLKHSLGGANRFAAWIESMFILHVFDHVRYNAREETAMPSLALK